MEADALELALVIDMTSDIIKDPLGHTRVGEDGKTVLEKQGVSNKQHHLSIPAPYRKISGFHVLDSDPIVHVPSIGRAVPQVIITVLKNGLGEDGGSSNGGGRWRHSKKQVWEVRVVAEDWMGK